MTLHLGKHILVELYGCDRDLLNDAKKLIGLSLEAVVASGAAVLHHHIHQFIPQGCSGVIVVAESHLAFHTWPEYGCILLDYFTCGERVRPEIAVDMIIDQLKPTRIERFGLLRGERPVSTERKEDHAPVLQHPTPPKAR